VFLLPGRRGHPSPFPPLDGPSLGTRSECGQVASVRMASPRQDHLNGNIFVRVENGSVVKMVLTAVYFHDCLVEHGG
jgi:hypothetical protein